MPRSVIVPAGALLAALLGGVAVLGAAGPAPAVPEPAAPAPVQSTTALEKPLTLVVFDRADISYVPPAEGVAPAPVPRGDVIVSDSGQTLERTVTLPADPGVRAAVGVTGVVTVEPLVDPNQPPRPGDPWTRMGSVGVMLPVGGGKPPMQVELMRFVTGFGAASRFECDLTAFMPVLWGERTLRLHLGTWKSPGWRVTFELKYEPGAAGMRRASTVVPLMWEEKVTAAAPRLQGAFTLLPGTDRPRIRVVSTGHGSQKGDEFHPRTHVLRVDGVEVARWRPWREDGNRARGANPWAERRKADGREVWASDADRSGWIPGRLVDPFLLPLDDLAPGRHRVELEVLDLKPAGPGETPNSWCVSVCLLADEAWPRSAAP